MGGADDRKKFVGKDGEVNVFEYRFAVNLYRDILENNLWYHLAQFPGKAKPQEIGDDVNQKESAAVGAGYEDIPAGDNVEVDRHRAGGVKDGARQTQS